MTQTVRRSVALTKPQIEWLKKEAKRLGITLAEMIRRIIDRVRENEK